ncbi:MAG: PAS domain-containing protein [Campylobacterales bacterium]|nr:PAS domain-containing protein [Campylobacterales bacterium]
MLKSKRFYLIAVAVVLISNMSYIDYLINKRTYLNEKLVQLQTNFENQINSHKLIADLFYSESIKNNEELKSLLIQIEKDPTQADDARKKLYNYFYNTYQYLSSKGFAVFHFHDSEGKSFLRFHKPEKYGDSLTALRNSIKNIVKDHTPRTGLEIGVYNEEIRYIYPIFDGNSFIGSVEISYRPRFLLNALQKQMGGDYTLLLSKETIDNKILEKTRKKSYKLSGIPNYYITKETDGDSVFNFNGIKNELLHTLGLNQPVGYVEQSYINPSTIFLFTPIKDIEGTQLGYLVAKISSDMPNWILYTQLVKLFIWMLILLIAIYLFNRTKKEQMRSEAILEQYKYAIDQSAIVSKTNPQGKITFVNEKFCQISGYKQEELIGQSHNIVRHPDSADSIFTHMWKTILSKQIWRGVLKNRRKNGEDYYVQSTITPILDKDENIIEFIAIREDVTSIIKHRNELKTDKQIKNVLLDNLGTTIVVQKDNEILYANRPFYERFQYNHLQELTRNIKRIKELFVSETGMALSEVQRQKIKDKLLSSSEPQKVHMLEKDGKVATIYILLMKVPFEQGHFYLFKLLDKIHDVPSVDAPATSVAMPSSNYAEQLKISESKLRLPANIHKGLVTKFIESMQKNTHELQLALNVKNFDNISYIAHNLKGSASTLVFETIATLASDLEEAAQKAQEEPCKQYADALLKELQKLTTAHNESTTDVK